MKQWVRLHEYDYLQKKKQGIKYTYELFLNKLNYPTAVCVINFYL